MSHRGPGDTARSGLGTGEERDGTSSFFSTTSLKNKAKKNILWWIKTCPEARNQGSRGVSKTVQLGGR